MKMAATMKSRMRQRIHRTSNAERRTTNEAALPGDSTFGVWFICSSSPTLPNRLRARTRQEFALPCAAVLLLRERDRNFPHRNKQQPFCPATTRPKTAAAIHSTGLHLMTAHHERDRARSPDPAERPPR